MNQHEIEILKILDWYPMTLRDLLKKKRIFTAPEENEPRPTFLQSAYHLLDIGYLERRFPSGQLNVTEKGRSALHEQEGKEFAQKTLCEKMDKISADYIADQNERDRLNRIEAAKNKKKEFRHDFAVAAFGAVLALLLEHIGNLISLLQKFFALFFSG